MIVEHFAERREESSTQISTGMKEANLVGLMGRRAGNANSKDTRINMKLDGRKLYFTAFIYLSFGLGDLTHMDKT
uniref:Uncharacterized protein n=1 Tax=Tetranychus urticae TaxID=32264 RepID=T1KE17_TETUR